MIKKHYLNWLIFVLVVLVAIAADQATKAGFEGKNISLIGNFLWVTSVHNTGAAFSMLEGARWWFVAIGLAVFAAICFVIFARKISGDKLFIVALAMIAGGIVGNVIDRIAYGFVRDFIDFRFSGFAIFNIADSVLCVGCALVVLWVIFGAVREHKNKKQQKNGKKENGSRS